MIKMAQLNAGEEILQASVNPMKVKNGGAECQVKFL
jgi:hypothetical protein